MLEIMLALESVLARAAGGWKVRPGAGEGAVRVGVARAARTDVLLGVSRLKAGSALIDALAALSLFRVASLPLKDCLTAAFLLKPSLGASALAVGAAAGATLGEAVEERWREELLVERM